MNYKKRCRELFVENQLLKEMLQSVLDECHARGNEEPRECSIEDKIRERLHLPVRKEYNNSFRCWKDSLKKANEEFTALEETPRYPIGTKYINKQKNRSDECAVVDVFDTFSLKTGELVRRRYVCSHDFFGVPITNHDVPEAAIARSQIISIPAKEKALVYHDFCDDEEKMVDFKEMTKSDFLSFYSYLTEEEYEMTEAKVKETTHVKET